MQKSSVSQVFTGKVVALVEIVQAIPIAETGDLGGGFVIPGEYPDLVAARL
jgi:hypothetical protein